MSPNPSTVEDGREPASRAGEASVTSVPSFPPPTDGPSIQRQDESRSVRWFVGLVALGLTALFLVHARAYRVPAHPGVDQNGYLVGGRQFAETLSMRWAPRVPGSTLDTFDPHQFVGNMWVGTAYGTAAEAYFPKYPLGLPFLVAIGWWIAGAGGAQLAYWISPVAMTLAVLGTYALARRILRSTTLALLGAAVFATSPVTLGLTNNPNSHAAAVCFVVWGIYVLVRWLESGATWRAVLAGLLLGYSATIRYSEGALLGVIVFAGAMRMLSRDPVPVAVDSNEIWDRRGWRAIRTWRECGWLLFGWAVPVGLLVAYNLVAMGRVTGYDSTNESVGFSFGYAADNWETLVRHLNTFGVTLLLPVALCGLAWMLRRDFRSAVLLSLWIAPCVVIYTFYYWAPDGMANQQQLVPLSYLRFFTTILPALVIAAFWGIGGVIGLARRLDGRDVPPPRVSRATLATLGAAALAGLVVIVQLQNALPLMENDQVERLNLATTTQEVLEVVPPGAVVFAPDQRLLQHLQFVGLDYALYSGQTFNAGWIQGLSRAPDQPDDPQALDPGRRASIFERLEGMGQPQLDDAARRIVQVSLEKDRRVFAIIPHRENDPRGERRRGGAGRLDRAGGPNAARGTGAAPRRPELAQLDPVLARALPADKFDVEVVANWNLITPRTYEVSRTRGARFRSPPNDRRQTYFQLIEISRRLPGTQPPAPAPAPRREPTAAPVRPATTASRPVAATQPAAVPSSQPAPASTAPAKSTTPTAATAPARAAASTPTTGRSNTPATTQAATG